ncbi:MAG: GNAT family N-acetyltransferase [Myxococcaceae bacterium]
MRSWRSPIRLPPTPPRTSRPRRRPKRVGPRRSRRPASATPACWPELKGQGIGRALYDRLIPTLRAQGYMLLLAGITQPNPASEKLHASASFIRCGVHHRAGWKFGAWHDVAYWELLLHPDEAQPRALLPVSEVWRGQAGDR